MQSMFAKQYIIEAFLQLLARKSFREISVIDIVKKAGISRSTFYLHFTDKFDLLEKIRKDLNAKFIEFYQKEGQSEEKPMTEALCLHILKYRSFYEMEFSSPENIQQLSNQLALQLTKIYDDQDYAIFASYGTIGYLSFWTKSGFAMSPQQVSEKLFKIGFTNWSTISFRKYNESLKLL